MGGAAGTSDEITVSSVRIDQPFYMGAMKISNAQYAAFDTDGRNNLKLDVMKTVRGGSWFDRPIHTGSAACLPYQPWQAVYNVGFRVVMSAESQPAVAANATTPWDWA